MTTISISLKDLLNVQKVTSINFTLLGVSFTVEGSTIKVGDTVTAITDNTGATSVNLSVGNYLVQVGSKKWTIGVSGSGTANLIDLVGISTSTPVQRGLPSGGATGQVLGKNSSTDYDTGWLTAVLTDNNFTTILKNAYDSAAAWVTTNGSAVLAHISSITNPHGVTKSQVGLGSVDNTSDLNKPVSTITQTALNTKQNTIGYTPEDLNNKSIDVNLGSSDIAYPTQNAVKTYTDNLVIGSINYRSGYDASTNVYPTTGGTGTAGAIRKGNMWIISVAGILGGQAIQVGDTVIANINTPGQTSSNWNTLNNNVTYVPEDVANKSTTMTGFTTSNIAYLTAKAVFDWATGLFINKTGDTITGDIGNSSTGFFRLPNRTTAQRPATPLNGMRRYNTDTVRDEFYTNASWQNHARLNGDTFTGPISATNLTNSNTGDETKATITTKLATDYGEVYQTTTNNTVTLSATAGTYVKAISATVAITAAGTNSANFTSGTSGASAGRLTYSGVPTKTFLLFCPFGIIFGSSTPTYSFKIAKNGTVLDNSTNTIKGVTVNAQSGCCAGIVTLAQNDYIELWATNDGAVAPSIRVVTLNLISREIF